MESRQSLKTRLRPRPRETQMDSQVGGQAAMNVMRLGKLCTQLDEVMIIEDLDDGHEVCRTNESVASSKNEGEETWMAPSLLDDDLVLGDCDSDDEVDCPASSSGRTTARRLMQARAQQCIVCIEEKEHTFVPPHQTTTCQVEGHRFCSDCWIDFLDHGLLVLRRGVSPAPLSCPICRSCIHVPDVWTVDVELPTVWQGTKKEVDSQVQCKEVQVLSPTSDSERSAEQSWVSAESAGSDDCAPERHMLPPLCRRVWAAAVRSGTPYLRTVLGDARSEASGFVHLDAIHNA